VTSEQRRQRGREEQWLSGKRTTFVRREQRYCRHCHGEVAAIAPALAWRGALPVIGTLGVLAVIGIMMIDPFGLVTLIVAGLVIALIGPLLALERRTPRCPHCRRETPYRNAEEAAEADRRDAERAAAERAAGKRIAAQRTGMDPDAVVSGARPQGQ
jgi:hypothetical protein